MVGDDEVPPASCDFDSCSMNFANTSVWMLKNLHQLGLFLPNCYRDATADRTFAIPRFV